MTTADASQPGLTRRATRHVVRRAVAAGTAYAVGRLVTHAGPAPSGTDADPWWRTNHSGDLVTLWEGPAAVAALAAGLLVTPGLSARTRTTATLTVVVTGAIGRYDDVAGGAHAKGLRGHLGALAHGEVTTGAVKVLGLSAVGLVAGATVRRGGSWWERVAAGALVAGSANLVNLLDLRAGRALKVVGLAAAKGQLAPGESGFVLAPVLGAVAAVAPEDLAARSMLGDCGANALGASVGLAGAAGLDPASLVLALGGVIGLTLASERVSFSDVIARTPWLRRLDELGRSMPSGTADGS